MTDWQSGTSANMLLTAALGLLLTVVIYLLLWGLRYFEDDQGVVNSITKRFLDRQWVPYVLVYLSAWSWCTLVIKARKLSYQKNSMLVDVLPTEVHSRITIETSTEFLTFIRSLPIDPSKSFLITRVARALEHFRVRRSRNEVTSFLASQSEIDANAVDSSYTLIRVFIWAIPILGFIGTVLGISTAVGNFSGTLEAADNLDVLKTSLNGVTSGLAMAFDTTLVALVLSLFVMIPASSLQNSEEDLLNWVDDYCNENLIKRLEDEQASTGSETLSAGSLQGLFETSVAPYQQELRELCDQIKSLGSNVIAQVAGGLVEIDKNLLEHHDKTLSHYAELRKQFEASIRGGLDEYKRLKSDLDQHMSGEVDRAAAIQSTLDTFTTTLDRDMGTLDATHQEAVTGVHDELQASLATLLEVHRASCEQATESMRVVSMTTDQHCQEATRAVQKLDQSLAVLQRNHGISPPRSFLARFFGAKAERRPAPERTDDASSST